MTAPIVEREHDSLPRPVSPQTAESADAEEGRVVRILRRGVTSPPVGVPVTLCEGRTRLGVIVIICVIFTAVGVGIVASGDRSLAAWATVALFGAGLVVLGWVLVHGGRTLALDAEGFEASIGLPWRRPIRVAWRDVTRFTTVQIPGQTIVGFHLRPDATPVTSPLRRLLDNATMIDPPDGTLPTVYGGMSAAETIACMERWRGRATAGRARRPSGRAHAGGLAAVSVFYALMLVGFGARRCSSSGFDGTRC